MNMVVNAVVYRKGRKQADLKLEDIDNWPVGGDQFIWVGLLEPDADLLRKLQKKFHLHDLAVEDAFRAHQRPKIENYGSSVFIALRTALRQGDTVEYGETHIFAARGYVITVRHGASRPYVEVRERCEAVPEMLKKAEDFVVYALIDAVVDHYFSVIEGYRQEVELIEASVFDEGFDREAMKRIYALKASLQQLRKIAAPVTEICNRLMRFDMKVIDEEIHPYFRDVHDHVLRQLEDIDALKDAVNFALEAKLMMVSFQQNDVMKKLAGWAAILAVPTAVAGIYGMNFEVMPELHWHYGYFGVLGLIGGVSGYLFYRFRRAGWL